MSVDLDREWTAAAEMLGIDRLDRNVHRKWAGRLPDDVMADVRAATRVMVCCAAGTLVMVGAFLVGLPFGLGRSPALVLVICAASVLLTIVAAVTAARLQRRARLRLAVQLHVPAEALRRVDFLGSTAMYDQQIARALDAAQARAAEAGLNGVELRFHRLWGDRLPRSAWRDVRAAAWCTLGLLGLVLVGCLAWIPLAESRAAPWAGTLWIGLMVVGAVGLVAVRFAALRRARRALAEHVEMPVGALSGVSFTTVPRFDASMARAKRVYAQASHGFGATQASGAAPPTNGRPDGAPR